MIETVHLAIYDTLADWEYGFAVAHIHGNRQFQMEPGRWRIRTVAETAEPVTTVGGITINPDMTVGELDAAGSAMLILPGADTWFEGRNAAFAKVAGAFLDAGVPVAAICGATYGLAAHGLFNDRAHTSGAPEMFAGLPGYTGVELYRDEHAVTDRGLITAGPTAPLEFARHIFTELDLYTPETLEAWHGLYSTGDPRYYAALMAATQATQDGDGKH